MVVFSLSFLFAQKSCKSHKFLDHISYSELARTSLEKSPGINFVSCQDHGKSTNNTFQEYDLST